MALKSTIFKATLAMADLNRHHYQTYPLTLARHPSETDERMMMRLLAFALNADASLSFCKGLSAEEEPDLWQKHLHGGIDLWIDVGQPTDKRLRQASGKSDRVRVYCYGGRSGDIWWQQIRSAAARLDNLEVFMLPAEQAAALAAMAQRTMDLQVTLEDEQIMVSDGNTSIDLQLQRAS